MKKMAVVFVLSVLIFGCVSSQSQKESRLSVKINGSAVEVQNFIEDKIRSAGTIPYQIKTATDREISFQVDCMDVPGMNSLKCALVMMGVGNSRWDGPYNILTFRTSEIRGVVNLTVSEAWCATNMAGMTKCNPTGSVSEQNKMLRKIQAKYVEEVEQVSENL